MSKVTVAASAAEIAAVAPQPKAKPTADSGEFKGMLSNAVKAEGGKRDATPKADNDAKTGQSRTKPEKTNGEKKASESAQKPQASQNEADSQAASEIAASAALMTTVADKAVEAEGESLNEVKPVTLQELGIRPVMTAEAWKSQADQAPETQPVQPEETIETETNPVQVETDKSLTGNTQPQTGANPVQVETDKSLNENTQSQAGINPVQVETNKSQEQAVQPQTETARPVRNHERAEGKSRADNTETQQFQAPQNEAAFVSRANAPVRTDAHADAAEVKAEADIEPIEVLTQTTEIREQAPIHPRPAKMTPEQAEQSQKRFEEMLARASRELGQGKTPEAVEASGAEEAPIQTQAVTETPAQSSEQTEAAAEVSETQVAETKQEQSAQTPPTARDAAPRFERRRENSISETDEAVLGMVQPSRPETSAPDVIRTETQSYPQSVRAPEQAEQIRTEVIRNLEDGKMEFRMRLNPRELGSIDVKMVLEGGRLAVEIAAASPVSAQVLSKQAESLVSSLKLNNVDVSYINVVEASANASGDMNSQYNLNSFQHRSGSQEQGGFNRNGGGHAPENQGQVFVEAVETPQRLLNYQV